MQQRADVSVAQSALAGPAAAVVWPRGRSVLRAVSGFLRHPATGVVVSVLVIVAGCVSASHADQDRIGTWGLIQALPRGFFVAVGVLSVIFFIELFLGTPFSGLVRGVQIAGLVLLLHGAPMLVESEPRFATAWLHAGFTGQILSTGMTAPDVDARFSWPGFFGAAASVTGAGGLDSAVPLLRWAPLLWLFLYLPPVYIIATVLTRSTRAAWLAVWLFVVANWVGQDYFAPQSLGYVLYLMSIAILVSFFRTGRQLPSGAWGRWLGSLPYDGFRDVMISARLRAALVVLLVLLQAALSATHQLSPIMLVLAAAALVAAGRCRLVVFPVVAGVLALGWISVGAEPYWVGHLDTMFGGVGNVGAVVDNSVVQRVTGSDAHRQLVLIRLVFTGAVWGCALVGALALWRRRKPPITLIALTVAPFGLMVQNYGSEGVIRIFLFSAPFACMLVAHVVAELAVPRWSQVLVAVLAIALVPLFLLTRYGNEAFEQVRPTELTAIEKLYQLAPPGAHLVSPTSQVPWRFEEATAYSYTRPADASGFLAADPAAVRRLVGAGDTRPTYLLITRGQMIYASQALRQPTNWFAAVHRLLTPTNGYRLLYRNPDALIYSYREPR